MWSPLGRTKDDVDSAVGVDDVRELPHAQRIRRLLERPLHLAAPEEAEVPSSLRRAAIGFRARHVSKLPPAVDNLLPEPQELVDGLLLRGRLDRDAVRIFP